MRIATWNLERAVPGSRRAKALLEHMDRIAADIWILTETHERIAPVGADNVVWSSIPERTGRPGERWVAIWSRHPLEQLRLEADSGRTAAARVILPGGTGLVVYGAVLPWLGSPWKGVPAAGGAAFSAALAAQSGEWLRFRTGASAFAVAGDLNQDLSIRHYYGSLRGRQELSRALAAAGLVCCTAGAGDPVLRRTGGARASIDHICINRDAECIASGAWPAAEEIAGGITDHFGVYADLRFA